MSYLHGLPTGDEHHNSKNRKHSCENDYRFQGFCQSIGQKHLSQGVSRWLPPHSIQVSNYHLQIWLKHIQGMFHSCLEYNNSKTVANIVVAGTVDTGSQLGCTSAIQPRVLSLSPPVQPAPLQMTRMAINPKEPVIHVDMGGSFPTSQ